MMQAGLKEKAEKLEKLPHARKVHYVQMGNLAKMQQKGVLTFTVPDVVRKITAKAIRVEAQSEQNYKWFGTVAGEETGHVIISCENGKMTGSIAVDERSFELRHFDGSIHTLTEINHAANATDCLSGKSPVGSTGTPDNPGPAREAGKSGRLQACYSPTRVLILATPAAAAANIDIGQTATASIDQYNYALAESRASSGARLVNSPETPVIDFFETDNIQDDIRTLANNPEAQQLRNQHQADLVVLLTNGNYPGIAGVARTIDVTNPADAYAIVQIGAATSNNTFAHEIGHLFGGAHEDDFREEIQPYAHGYRFERRRWPSVRRYRTLMHTYLDNYARILRYSTPHIRFDDEVPGNKHTNHVVRRINERQADINTFRAPFSGLTAYIEGPTYVPLYQSASWEAVYSCGAGPYSFEWSFSWDGFNYYSAGSEETAGNIFYFCNETLYIQLTVRSSDGQEANSFTTAFTDNCGDPYRIAASRPDFDVHPEKTALFDAHPNPANQTARIDFFLPEAQSVKLELLSPTGRVVDVLADGLYEAGQHSKAVDALSLRSGIYFYRLTADRFSQTKKLIIAR